MQKLFPVLILSFFISANAQAQLADDFSDGDFTRNPAWTGDTALFRITPDRKLQSDGPNATSVISLATPCVSTDSTVWEFSVTLNFAPSGSNHLRVYLASNQANLKTALNGYYIRIGETGSNDGVDLHRQNGTASTKIIDGIASRAAANPVALRIRVLRDNAGNWRLFSRKGTESEWVTEGSAIDNAFAAGAYFGVSCYFTATNRQRFTLDDFKIVSFETPKPPVPPAIGFRELVINEIFADESPRVELPAAEFVELYNPTDQTVNLKNCTLGDPTAKAVLPDVDVPPKSYIILCANAFIADFQPFGSAVGLSNFPSLNNAGDEITLRNPVGQIIDQVAYSDKWYRDATKSDGGWSLEQIDAANACGEEGNWLAANAGAGGTPGKPNSVAASKPDQTPPVLLAAEMPEPNRIRLVFNERMDTVSMADPLNYSTEPNLKIVSFEIAKPVRREVILTLAASVQPKTVYTLTARNLKDCNQNAAATQQVRFALPEPADSSDVVINEVLFNPRVGGVDFVEVYNRSDKYINLKDWQLANVENSLVANRKTCTAANRLLPPGTYAVFTTDVKLLATYHPKYRPETVVAMPLPTYYDEAGTVVLLDSRGRIIDRFDYSEDFHFPMLADKEGVSLERIAFAAPTNNAASWHSAAATEGYATPGYLNSQTLQTVSGPGFRIEPKVITPNEDGYHDFAALHYQFATQGNLATVTVFDVAGRQVRQLANNVSLATEGFFTWDGTNQSGAKVRSGRYVVALSVFNADGSQRIFKEDVVVGW